jgi:hypothetical protein
MSITHTVVWIGRSPIGHYRKISCVSSYYHRTSSYPRIRYLLKMVISTSLGSLRIDRMFWNFLKKSSLSLRILSMNTSRQQFVLISKLLQVRVW